MTPAEELREAARLMRERAEAATPGRWDADGDERGDVYNPGVHNYPPDGTDPVWVAECGPVEGRGYQDAEHIAGWHPVVALLVADWIDCHGRDLASAGGDMRFVAGCDSPGDVQMALTVARTYLGSVS